MDNKKNSGWLMSLLGIEKAGKNKSYYWLVLLVLAGVAIMILASFLDITEQAIPYEATSPSKQTAGLIDKDSTPKTMQDYEKIFENQLTELLTSMLGVQEVTVKINLDSTEELVVERNTSSTEQITNEKDNQGGTRNIRDSRKDEEVVIYRTDSNEQPLVLKILKPKVRGVVVVAKGAENIKIRAMITEAVQSLLNVQPHNIAVFPRKN